MNLIQTLPPLSPQNMRFLECMYDYLDVYRVTAFFDAGGPRFKAIEECSFFDLTRNGSGKYEQADARREMHRSAMRALDRDINSHLAVINPIPND